MSKTVKVSKQVSQVLPTGARASRKSQIVEATKTLLTERGLGGVTTRAIAEAVPCSEGAIYVHFQDRLELILLVLEESLPAMLTPLRLLESKVGAGTPAENLGTALRGLFKFHDNVLPMLCSLFAEAELRRRFRESLLQTGKGPRRGIKSLATYIEQEQKLGRVSIKVDPETSAAVLMAASFFYVFTSQLLDSQLGLSQKRLIELVLMIPQRSDKGRKRRKIHPPE
jgi:AcrR family transcriptional regulator